MKNPNKPVKSKSVGKSTASKHRPLHRRISLHPITILFLLCVGVLMIATTFKTFGASSQLSMNITASPIVDPAVINKPADQDRFSKPDISVSGTCPSDSYVKLYKNGGFNGVAPCESGKFEFSITLSGGSNLLSVKVFNFSDQEGPASGSITVYYEAPLVSTTEPLTPANAQPLQKKNLLPADRLRILTDYKYKVHKSGQPVHLDLALAGGTAPYAVAIYWNDGKITPISRPDKSVFAPEHTYEKRPRLSTYVIKIAVGDFEGNSDYIQLMAVIDGEKAASQPGTASTTSARGGSNGGIQTLLKYLWPAYLIVVLMVLCFYLGEREERRILLNKKQKPLFRS